MRLLDIPDILRAFGLEPVEISGWRTRGREYPDRPEVAVVHHTVGAKSGDYPSLNTVKNGRPDVPGPLANVGQGRHDPWKVYVFASGVSNNAGRGSYRGYAGNPNTFGAELEHTGYTSIRQGPPPYSAVEHWDDPAARMEAHLRLCAAMCKIIRRDESWLCAHFEWTPRKVDPRDWNMPWVRQQSGLFLRGEHPSQQPILTPPEEDDVIHYGAGPSRYIKNLQFMLNRMATDQGGPLSMGWVAKDGVAGDQTFQAVFEALQRIQIGDFALTATVDLINLGSPPQPLTLGELMEEGIDPVMVAAITTAAGVR